MRNVELLMMISSALWIVSAVYLIYAIGQGILTLQLQPALSGIIIFVFASVAQLVVAILNE